ncbi:hypothetical protein [Nocardia araoensis]|uniref:hypothetical protein n=1 Tax=Nocardia araoensis TaxID=228600 RepID=UPI001FE1C205|nr:hypothetical protein [Nocardia araoensis]
MVVGELQAELPVDLEFVGGVSCLQYVNQPAQRGHKLVDLLLVHVVIRPLFGFERGELCRGGVAFALNLLGPARHKGRLGARFQGCSIPGQLAVVFGKRSSCTLDGGRVVGLRVLEHGQRLLDPVGVEYLGQP